MFSRTLRRELKVCLKLIKREYHPKTSFAEKERRKIVFDHVFQKIYPWRNLDEFVDYLHSNILFNDGVVIAIPKPFGVGTHFPEYIIKQRDQIDPKAFGNVRYCIKDALPGLAERLNSPELHIAVTGERTVGGITVLGTSKEIAVKINRKCANTRRFYNYPMIYWCITSGIPLIKHNELKERVGIEKIVIDPRTHHVAFDIKYNPTKSYLNKDHVKSVRCQIKILEQKTRLGVALVEIRCSRVTHNFIRCYLASKGCFALGDPRFSSRVGRILGAPVVIPARSSVPDFEPVPKKILDRLKVDKNTAIPLMVQMKSLAVEDYPFPKRRTLFENRCWPEYFKWAIDRLISTE